MPSLAMNRTSRFAGCAPSPAKVKSMYPVWLMAMTAPPWAGTCSVPVIVNFSPRPTKVALATPITAG